MDAGFQKIVDMNKDQRIAELERQLAQKDLAASQAAQNLAIFANNQMQTDTIMNYLNPPYARAYPPTTAAATAG